MKPNQRQKTYATWAGMKQRCYNPNAQQWKNYGARGIVVCQEWRESFNRFVADMGLRPEGLTLDRIDNNGNYEPSNCRWATRAEQRVNQRDCVYVEHDGKRMTIEQWGRESGIRATVLRRRYHKGITGDALFAPSDPKIVANITRASRIRWTGGQYQATECYRGHPFDAENTLIRRSDGRRLCRTCHRLGEQRRVAIKSQREP